jgi:hypothetical protein
MMTWRPIREYPVVLPKDGQGPIVLARDQDKRPILVVLIDGHFRICPGIFMFYGDHQSGFMTADHVVEFMEIPA